MWRLLDRFSEVKVHYTGHIVGGFLRRHSNSIRTKSFIEMALERLLKQIKVSHFDVHNNKVLVSVDQLMHIHMDNRNSHEDIATNFLVAAQAGQRFLYLASRLLGALSMHS